MIVVTGGARSGKSSFGEGLLKNENQVLYIATSIPFDDEMKDRVKKHKESRPSHWHTLEGYKGLGKSIRELEQSYDGVILDCITIMISNLILENFNEHEEMDYEKLEAQVMEEIREMVMELKKLDSKVVLITNEVGCGIVPENRLGREFRDIAGRVNQYLARESEEVYLAVSGIGVKIKG